MWHSRPPRDPPPFLANTILNFHFDYLHTSLRYTQNVKTRKAKLIKARTMASM